MPNVAEIHDPDRQPQGSWPYMVYLDTGVVLIDRGPNRPRWRCETKGALIQHSGTTCDVCGAVILVDSKFTIRMPPYEWPTIESPQKPKPWPEILADLDPMRHLPKIMHEKCADAT